MNKLFIFIALLASSSVMVSCSNDDNEPTNNSKLAHIHIDSNHPEVTVIYDKVGRNLFVADDQDVWVKVQKNDFIQGYTNSYAGELTGTGRITIDIDGIRVVDAYDNVNYQVK